MCVCVLTWEDKRRMSFFFWLCQIYVIQNTLDKGLLLHLQLTVNWVKINTNNESQMLFALNLILGIPFLKLKFYKIPKLCCFKRPKSERTIFTLTDLFIMKEISLLLSSSIFINFIYVIWCERSCLSMLKYVNQSCSSKWKNICMWPGFNCEG